MNRILLTILLFGLLSQTLAQTECGYIINYNTKLKTITGYDRKLKSFEEQIKIEIEKRKISLLNEEPAILTIPVVFHIVWKTEEQKLPESTIRIQLARLNEDYNNMNYDLKYVPDAFKPFIGNMRIKFVLAQTDPDNHPTNGILYKQTETGWDPIYTLKSRQYDNYMKLEDKGGSKAWNITKYLNIWVCDAGNELNGFAEPPVPPLDVIRDGVVISWKAFSIHGNNHPLANFGRTLPHEIGHWLGLKHTWGDDDWKETDTEFCMEDDDINDTPRQLKRSDNSRLRSFSSFILKDCDNTVAGSMWMNYMDYSVHLNRIMFTQGQVDKARTVLETTRSSLLESPGLKPPQHNTGIYEVFRTNAFTTLAIGKGGQIWAGTDKFGLYKYDFNTWTEVTALANRDIKQIAADRNGGIWIAQSGHEGLRGIGGGLNYFETGNISIFTYFAPSIGLSSRVCRGVYIDTNLAKPNYNVWTAHDPEINYNSNAEPIFAGGEIGFKPFIESFQKISAGLLATALGPNTYSVKAIQGNASEVWAFDFGAFNQPQIVRYNPTTRQVLLPTFTPANTNGILPASFFVNCFYFDKQGNKWVGLEKGGVAYADAANAWHKLTLPETLSADVAINAITADNAGNFFIGTSEGLLVTKFSDIQDPAKFKLMRIEDDIPSDNVTALAVHEEKGLLIVATDNGMTFLTKDCLLQPCIAKVPPVYYSTKDGNWGDPTIWSGGKVPECGSIVVIMDHKITAVSKSQAASVHLVGSTLRVENGVQFVLCN